LLRCLPTLSTPRPVLRLSTLSPAALPDCS